MSQRPTSKGFPLAMDPPAQQVVVITQDLVQQAIEASRISPRRRIILPFHKSNESTLHRMLNAVQPGSYIRPHRHLDPPKDESLILVKGAICVFIFEDDSQVRQRIRLAPGAANLGIDVAAGVYHTFIVLEPDTVVFEAKPGPYVRATDKDFAPWAPAEGTEASTQYMASLVSKSEFGEARPDEEAGSKTAVL